MPRYRKSRKRNRRRRRSFRKASGFKYSWNEGLAWSSKKKRTPIRSRRYRTNYSPRESPNDNQIANDAKKYLDYKKFNLLTR